MTGIPNEKLPQMPMATAIWLIDNTALTFGQIADFTGLHEIEVQAIADEEVAKGMKGENPLSEEAKIRLTPEEIARCEKDSAARLKPLTLDLPPVKVRSKGPKYTPVARRGDKPDAIAWIVKHHPEISDAQICTLVGTTKPTIESVRNRTHPASQTLKPRHPGELGLCTYADSKPPRARVTRPWARIRTRSPPKRRRPRRSWKTRKPPAAGKNSNLPISTSRISSARAARRPARTDGGKARERRPLRFSVLKIRPVVLNSCLSSRVKRGIS